MTKKGRKLITRVSLIIGLLIIASLALNWFMTYRLEDTLRKRLRAEVIKATDGFYDFSFDKLHVGLFSGELMIKGLSLYPDSTALEAYRNNKILPNFYFDFQIDTIEFIGINLTWLFDYRKLSFEQFLVKKPKIKIVSSHKKDKLSVSKSVQQKSLFESVSPYFDVIQARLINFERADIEYIVEDSTVSNYRLKDFRFTAHQFSLDDESQDKEYLLFSENFDFSTKTLQTVFDSEQLQLSLNAIELNTTDSTIYFGGVHLEPKAKYWDQRVEIPGGYPNINVGAVELSGIAFSRQGAYNFLDSKHLNINNPTIEYYNVAEEDIEEHLQDGVSDLTTWSLYSLTSPIMERIAINKIDIGDASFKYVETDNKQTDLYTLNNLDFEAFGFIVDSLNRDYNMLNYVDDFSVDASNVQGQLESKNTQISVDHFTLSSIDGNLKISEANLSPISQTNNKDFLYGKLKSFEIEGMEYKDGVDAKIIRITSPQIDYTKVTNSKPIKKIGIDDNKNILNHILDAVAPFVSYVSVKDIIIEDANTSFTDKRNKQKYQLQNLDFYAKNFYIDQETRRFRDYFFSWDEYDIRFKKFDNLTPDKNYRIRIDEGDFNSITGNILLTNLKITPEKKNIDSYVSISTPYAQLLGWNEKSIRDKKLSFKTLIIENPVIEVVKKDDRTAKKAEKNIRSIALDLINFDLLTIPSPSFFYHNEVENNSIQGQAIQIHLDSFRWELNDSFNIHNIVIESPNISVINNKEGSSSERKEPQIDIASFGDFDIKRINVRKPTIKLLSPNSQIDISVENYLLDSFYWSQRDHSIFRIDNLDLVKPNINVSEKYKPKEPKEPRTTTKQKVIEQITKYADETYLGRINISDLNLKHTTIDGGKKQKENRLVDTDFLVENLHANLHKENITVDELAFKTHDINFPVADSFYTFKIDNLNFSKRKGELNINDIRLNANYPKFDYAYMHPRGADWFNLEINNIALSGIDASKLLADTILLVKKMRVDNALLENLKNQKIEIEHNIMPLLYEQFQQFPIKYYIDDLDIRDFTVIYEELAKNGYEPARIPFSSMNGRVKGFTNIQRNDSTFYALHVDGLAMGTAPFIAEWKIPVDSINDKFYLTAEIKDLDMQDFNQLIRPMTPAFVKSGRIEKLRFETEASSLGAAVNMEFVYDSLYLVLLRDMHSNEINARYTRVLNRWGLEEKNLGENRRTPHNVIIRDPYHSNFNYFWQILQPPLIESVGISQEKQNLASNLVTIYNRIKRLFKREKKKEKNTKDAQ